MKETILLEACVETLEEALLAQQNGAHRIELCARLDLGGITPSYELTDSCISRLSIPVMVMVRPRGGNFVYSEAELDQMEKDIEHFRQSRAAGIVLGLLDADNEVDIFNTQRLASLASPMEVTFHKAIDETSGLLQSCLMINDIPGITRILTSGGKDTAWDGREILRQMNSLPNLRLKILAAGKITYQNFRQIAEATGVHELHGRRIVQI